MNLNNWALWIPLKRKSKLRVNRWYSAVPKTSFKSTEIKWKWELPQRHEIHLKKLSVIIMAKFSKFCNEQPSLKSATWLSRCRWSFRLRPTFMSWMSSKKSVAAEVILCYIPQKCSWYSVTPCTITWIKKKINNIQTLEQSINSHSEMFTNAEEEKKSLWFFLDYVNSNPPWSLIIINSWN